MRRNLTLACVLCFSATTVFAQSGFNGRWATDRPADPQRITDPQRAQRVQLEVTIEGDKASGTLAFGGIGGRFDTFKDGKLSGNRVQFRTVSPAPNPMETTWTIELVDENTVTMSRALPEVVGNVQDLINAQDLRVFQLPPALRFGAAGLPVVPSATVEQVITNAPVRGIVRDRSKALIPGVKITARNVDTGAESTTIADVAGRYAFPDVIPGKYTMTASLPGFQTSTVSNLSIGDTQLVQDFTLEVSIARASHPPVASCSPAGIVWCSVLHRTK